MVKLVLQDIEDIGTSNKVGISRVWHNDCSSISMSEEVTCILPTNAEVMRENLDHFDWTKEHCTSRF
jgi:hypothetical protein